MKSFVFWHETPESLNNLQSFGPSHVSIAANQIHCSKNAAWVEGGLDRREKMLEILDMMQCMMSHRAGESPAVWRPEVAISRLENEIFSDACVLSVSFAAFVLNC